MKKKKKKEKKKRNKQVFLHKEYLPVWMPVRLRNYLVLEVVSRVFSEVLFFPLKKS
jgi:hypothetical protein